MGEPASTALAVAAVLGTGYGIYQGEEQRKDARDAMQAKKKELKNPVDLIDPLEAEREKRRRSALKNPVDDTVLTSPLGLTGDAPATRKTLLGS